MSVTDPDHARGRCQPPSRQPLGLGEEYRSLWSSRASWRSIKHRGSEDRGLVSIDGIKTQVPHHDLAHDLRAGALRLGDVRRRAPAILLLGNVGQRVCSDHREQSGVDAVSSRDALNGELEAQVRLTTQRVLADLSNELFVVGQEQLQRITIRLLFNFVGIVEIGTLDIDDCSFPNVSQGVMTELMREVKEPEDE
jgi:hypothetical protein